MLSDIHGVPPALDAVLAEPAVRTAWAARELGPDHLDWLASLPLSVLLDVPFARLANRRQIVNPGSVGMPYGRAGAHWALLVGGAVELRRTAYDVLAACASVCAESAYPDIAEWTDYFLHSRASDADALAVMAPRDGRLLRAALLGQDTIKMFPAGQTPILFACSVLYLMVECWECLTRRRVT